MYYIFDMIYKIADAAGASTTGKEVLAAILANIFGKIEGK